MRFTIPYFVLVLGNLSQWQQVNAQVGCNTPELNLLETWASDVRQGASDADLGTIGSSTCPTEPSRQKVLVIGIDGFRADAAGMLPLPNLRRLERIGSYSYWATVQKTGTAVSGPGWASLYTGVEVTKHKVDGNGDVTDIDLAYPNFLKAAKDAFGKTVAASVTWHPLIEMIDKQDPNTLDGSYKANDDGDMIDTAIGWIENASYDIVFAAIDSVDGAGHSTGFDGYADTYMQAVMGADLRVGRLLDAVLSRSGGEEWLIVITTDHGGLNFSHGGQDTYNRRIPFMVASNSNRVKIGRAPHDDPGSQMDVLPTVMHFLGGESAIPSNLDGQPFGFRDFVRTPPSNVACEASKPDECGCAEALQADYRGTISKTVTGKTCQRWDSQFPHEHSNTPGNNPLSGLEENYCRNPDGEDGGAWCYTTDENDRWEYCDVPVCGENTGGGACENSDPDQCGCAEVDQADYRGTVAKTMSGKTCQRWDAQAPHSHTRTAEEYPDSGLVSNYCRNPDGEDGAWCYTTDPNTRWELCDVSTC